MIRDYANFMPLAQNLQPFEIPNVIRDFSNGLWSVTYLLSNFVEILLTKPNAMAVDGRDKEKVRDG